MPRLCEVCPGICLTTEKKARKNLSQGKKTLSQVKKNFSQSTTEPQSEYSCKANARVYLAKAGHGPHSSELVNRVVLRIVCVDCVVLCIVCV